MMRKLIDLTRPLVAMPESAFPPALRPLHRIIAPTIDFVDHARGAAIMCELFNCTADDLPEREGWAEDTVTISSHLGTHVDAPWHTGSRTAGKPAKTVDQIPLEDLYCHGVVLDVTHKKSTGQPITIEDLQNALTKIDYKIKAGDAVMMRTDHDKFELTDPARYSYPGMTRESTLWLAEQGAKVAGTDALGWDRPFPVMIAEFQQTKRKEAIWDAHYACRDVELYVVQQLVNLDKLPPHGFEVCFFPILLVGASAAPARVVAFVGESVEDAQRTA
jgi:kynurenine formamidase